MAEKFGEETFELLMKGNQINDEKFNEFHKIIFNEMMEQSIFLACDLSKKKGEQPDVGDFDKKVTNLTKEIMSTKIDLLGSHLRK